ncbi:MAG: type III pantothenate kinase [Planctomycetota bacterium]
MTAAPLLTLDRGNSTLDAMLHGDPPLRRRLAAGGDDHAAAAQLTALLGAIRPARCVAVSVVPGGLDGAERALAGLGVSVLRVGRELRCPLPLDYDTPETLGADRWLGALAAHRSYGRAVVVDCGTATTVNLVEDDGAFRGGAIAPGLDAILAGMSRVTPNLPAADPDGAWAMPPRSSAQAVHAGAVLAFCGAVERLVADTLRVARGPCAVVLTGGRAEVYLRHGRLRPRHEPDLVHQGLRRLAEEAGCVS